MTNTFGSFEVKSFDISGLFLITPKVFGDDRGFFTERFKKDLFAQMGLPEFIQENYSRSQDRVLRGLHFQYDKPQAKLVTATRGSILDVAVDIRRNSKTFGQSVCIRLDGNQPQWFFMPAGFAHGFCVLSPEGADVMYKVDSLYNPKGEGSIRWNDPELGINWQMENPLLSGKDQVAPWFADYKKNPFF